MRAEWGGRASVRASASRLGGASPPGEPSANAGSVGASPSRVAWAWFKLRLQSRVAGVDAYWASLVVLRGAKDAQCSYPPKVSTCRHGLTGIGLTRVDTFWCRHARP